MPFKIRTTEAYSSKRFREAKERYQAHLQSFPGCHTTDLWKYFASDFFHDGRIRSIRFKQPLDVLSIRISCPNLERVEPSGERAYLDMDFICTFFDVSRFSVRDLNRAKGRRWRRTLPTYLYSEINTRLPRGAGEPERADSSLLIQALGQDEFIWYEVIFGKLSVAPADPAAFAAMEADPLCRIPIHLPPA